MARWRRVANALGLAILIAVVLPFVVFAVPQTIGAEHSYVVLSSSMSPAIHAGDVVIVESDVDPSRIHEGDVITFEPPADRGAHTPYVTHRVVEVVQRDDGLYFRTKGDANEDPDPTPVSAENVVGRSVLTIPLIGHVLLVAGSDDGIFAFVVVPAVLLILSELYDLARVATAAPEDPDAGESTADGRSRGDE